MARATRSAKRKREDDDNAPQPPTKHLRHDSFNPIDPLHATAILDILSIIDTQGLLDRVFPIHELPERSSSLRNLLGESNQSFSVLCAAIDHLKPISSLPRAKPSPTATQQHRFCTLAVDLLNQASSHSVPLPSSLDVFLPPSSPNKPKPLKYALVQHLPTQDYWTSLNDDTDLNDALKSLPTAHAELVAVFPTPSLREEKYPVPTLAAYAPTRSLASTKNLPQQRTVTTGSFLDFGPWASFAPTFDHNEEVVGRAELGLALYASHERRLKRINVQREAKEGRGSIEEIMVEETGGGSGDTVDLEKELGELLPPEEAAAVKAALDTMELEAAVQELLDRNRSALVRLEQMQIARLVKDGERSTAEEGSEEWDTAQGILDTLTVLASLRPRTSKEPSNIVPPPAILHKLHRTLAVTPSPGWHGTLPASRPVALSDDTTFKKSSRAPAPVPTPVPTPVAAPAAAPAVPANVTAPVAMPYTGYTYAYGQQGQQPYRPGSATATNGTYAPYTPQYYAYAPQQQQGGTQPPTYYGQQQQGYAAASYSSWYGAYQQQQQQQGTGGSGTSTPTGTYGSFFARTPAVANTVYAPPAPPAATGLPPHLRGQGQQQYYAYQPK